MGKRISEIQTFPVEEIMLYEAYDCLFPFGSTHEILAKIAAYTAKSDEWKKLMPDQYMDQEFQIDSDKLNEMRQKVAGQFSTFAKTFSGVWTT